MGLEIQTSPLFTRDAPPREFGGRVEGFATDSAYAQPGQVRRRAKLIGLQPAPVHFLAVKGRLPVRMAHHGTYPPGLQCQHFRERPVGKGALFANMP